MSDLIKYSLKLIQTNNFSFRTPKENIDEKGEIAYTLTPLIKYDLKNSFIIVVITAKIYIKGKEEILSDSETVFVYNIVNLKDYMETNEETNISLYKDKKHEALNLTLVGMSISTLRGILFEKLQGTILENQPLPIMDTRIFFPQTDKAK